MSKTYVSVKLRRLVFERAQGCCEYCLIPEFLSVATYQVDHVIAEKHGGETISINLALSCPLCNLAKGSDIASIDPLTGETEKLYHPRRDRWSEHFALDKTTGEIKPLTPIARATERLMPLNRSESVAERSMLSRVGRMLVPD
jgi:HNH endonuclease